MRQVSLSMEGLIAVVIVAQEGNLERAVKALGLGRLAVGMHVGIVEAEVGTPLFDRHGGRWVLNEESRLFAPKAFQSILYAYMGLDLVQSHVGLQTNRLFVGYSTFPHPRLIDVIEPYSSRGTKRCTEKPAYRGCTEWSVTVNCFSSSTFSAPRRLGHNFAPPTPARAASSQIAPLAYPTRAAAALPPR